MLDVPLFFTVRVCVLRPDLVLACTAACVGVHYREDRCFIMPLLCGLLLLFLVMPLRLLVLLLILSCCCACPSGGAVDDRF